MTLQEAVEFLYCCTRVEVPDVLPVTVVWVTYGKLVGTGYFGCSRQFVWINFDNNYATFEDNDSHALFEDDEALELLTCGEGLS